MNRLLLACLLGVLSARAQTPVRLYLNDGSELVCTIDHALTFKTELGVFDLALDRLAHVRRQSKGHAIHFTNSDLLTGQLLNELKVVAAFGAFTIQPEQLDELVVGGSKSARYAEWSDPVAGLMMRLVPERQQVKPGEDFTLTLELKNVSTEPIVFPEPRMHEGIRTVDRIQRKNSAATAWIAVEYAEAVSLEIQMEKVLEERSADIPICLAAGGVFRLKVLVSHSSTEQLQLHRLQGQATGGKSAPQPREEIARLGFTRFHNVQDSGPLAFRGFFGKVDGFPARSISYKVWDHALVTPPVQILVQSE
ncbi:MAG: hypothetical protein ACI97B_001564 [Verrucomicrobiales bacterium]|jgi:hypothetical protein